jgi:hypothetical protein
VNIDKRNPYRLLAGKPEGKETLGIFGPKKSKVIGVFRELSNEKLHNVCPSPSIIRKIKLNTMRLALDLARMRQKRRAYSLLMGKPEGKRL